MPKLDPITDNVIRVPESIDTNAADKPLTPGSKIKHSRDTTAGDDDISSWIDENDTAARAATAAAQHALGRILKDRPKLPNPDAFEVDDIIIAENSFYKLGVSDDGDGTTASVYTGTIDKLYYSNAFGGDVWRGIANTHGPDDLTSGGRFTSNPDNAIAMVLASGARLMRVAVRKSVYEAFKGSPLRLSTSESIHMDLMLESGNRDQTKLVFFDLYTADGEEYVVFQFQNDERVGNFALWSEPLGNTFSATFYVGDDTSGTQFTHPASAKHWVLFSPTTGNMRNTRLRDFIELPDTDDYNANDVILAEDNWYKLGITSNTTEDLFEGTIGDIEVTVNSRGTDRWRGIASLRAPDHFNDTIGAWTSNPENALTLLMASNDGHMRMAMTQLSYVTAKGSALQDTDKIAIEVTLAGDAVDSAVLSHRANYSRDGEDFILWEASTTTAGENFNLKDADEGSDLGVRLFTVDGDGNATTTPFLTHSTSTKHWILFNDIDPDAATRADVSEVQQTADANAARLDALDSQVDGDAVPIHEFTVDDTTDLGPHSQHSLWSMSFDNIDPDTLIVVDWENWEHLRNHAEHSLPGSTPAAGRMYVRAKQFGLGLFNGEFGFASDADGVQQKPRQQNDNSEVQTSLLTDFQYASGTKQLVFTLEANQVNARSTARLYPPVDFKMTVRMFVNTSILTATEGSIHSQLRALKTDVEDLLVSHPAERSLWNYVEPDGGLSDLEIDSDSAFEGAVEHAVPVEDDDRALVRAIREAQANNEPTRIRIAGTLNLFLKQDPPLVPASGSIQTVAFYLGASPRSGTSKFLQLLIQRHFTLDNFRNSNGGRDAYGSTADLVANFSSEFSSASFTTWDLQDDELLTFILHGSSINGDASVKAELENFLITYERAPHHTYTKTLSASAAVHSIGAIDTVPDHWYWQTVRIYAGGVISTIPWPADRIALPNAAGGLSGTHPAVGPVTLRASTNSGTIAHPYYAQVFIEGGEYKINFRGTDGAQYMQAYIDKIELDYAT